MNDSDILDNLWQTIQDRKERPKGSYTNKLLDDKELLFSKLREELAEIEESSRDGRVRDSRKDSLVWETADFLYHLFVLLSADGAELNDVFLELKRRHDDKR